MWLWECGYDFGAKTTNKDVTSNLFLPFSAMLFTFYKISENESVLLSCSLTNSMCLPCDIAIVRLWTIDYNRHWLFFEYKSWTSLSSDIFKLHIVESHTNTLTHIAFCTSQDQVQVYGYGCRLRISWLSVCLFFANSFV